MTARAIGLKLRQRIIGRAVGGVCHLDRLEQRFLLAAHPVANWYINGDHGGKPTDDIITIQVSPKDANTLQAVVNGTVVSSRAVSKIRGIQVSGLRGNDDITIDLGLDYKDIAVTINGGLGDDTITGGAGSDYLLGGPGADSISGGMGDDSINGGAGNDILSGDEGDDLLIGGTGADTLAGGLGDDTLNGGDNGDYLSGGYGDDKLYGQSGVDTLIGGDGNDSLYGGVGKDTVYHESNDYWDATRYDVSKTDIRDNPLQKVTDTDALKQQLIDSAIAQWKWAFGQPANPWWYWPGIYYKGGLVDSAAGPSPTTSDNSSHSNTNDQVAGVDEGDMVKTDGNYIYLVHNNELLILNAWPADQTQIVSRTTLDGWSSNIYLDGNRLTVLSSTWESLPVDNTTTTTDPITGSGDSSAGDVAPGMMVKMLPIWGGWWGKSQVTVTVYDVSDPTTPTVVTKTVLDGSLTTSRDIGGRLYMVVDNNMQLPQPKTLPGDKPNTYVYENEADYRARLEAMTLDELLPQYTTTVTAADGTTSQVSGGLTSVGSLYAPTVDPSYNSLFSVALMNVNDPAPQLTSTTSVVGFSGEVYASTSSLYVTNGTWDAPMGYWQGDYQTDIYKFNLDANSIDLAGVGEVPGWTVDQFAMDESNGYFRIATTTETDGQSNNVFVMENAGDNLNVTGAVTGIALGERIYAARFVGDRAYLVTYRQTDPLFTIDLSDPADPQMRGELQIPGYSSYLHPVGDNLLIGFGRNGDAAGHVGGLQVSLFDVSDIENPKRLDVMSLDTTDPGAPANWWSSYSDAEWDHHAFSYFADKQIIAVPVLDWNWWNGSGKLELIKVDPTAGTGSFSKLGEIQQDGQVLRSVQIGNYIYSIGSQDVKVVAIADPSTNVADVVLDPDNTGDTTGGTDGGDTVDAGNGDDTTGDTTGTGDGTDTTTDPTGGGDPIIDVAPLAASAPLFQSQRLIPALGDSGVDASVLVQADPSVLAVGGR